jgi:hypothetical protein
VAILLMFVNWLLKYIQRKKEGYIKYTQDEINGFQQYKLKLGRINNSNLSLEMPSGFLYPKLYPLICLSEFDFSSKNY